MSGFDTIFRGKKNAPKTHESSEEVRKKNTGKKVYKDIHKKREKVLLVKPQKNIYKPKKISSEEKVFRIQESIKKFGNSLKKRQIVILLLVLFLSYVVYGVGFVLRTEHTIKTIVASPKEYYNVEKIKNTVYTLWQDYQILGLVADNSPIPLEPLTSYGTILKNTRLLIAESENIKKMADDILNWKNVSQKESIFPLLDIVWGIGENGEKSLKTLANSLFTIVRPDRLLEKRYNQYMGYLSAFLEHKEVWYDLLSKTRPTRILILNQNNDELRAGGGFPGTVFLVELEGGKIKNISFHDIYELDGRLTEYIEPPEGINQFKAKAKQFAGRPVEFRIRDANYYPTFAESARRINALANASKIGDIDLVIGINTSLIADVIELIGPISIPGISVPLDRNNIALILSMLVEAKEVIHGIPKGIITVLGDNILNALIEQKKTVEIGRILWENLESGEILLASPRADIQQALDSMNIFDTWKTYTGDFIYPIFTSIGKNKTDRIMKRALVVKELNDCKREVTLTQKHGWNIETEAQIKNMAYDLGIADKIPVLLPIQGGSNNVQYIRFVLPKGSSIESSGNTRLTTLATADPASIAGGYITTPLGQSSTIKFFYTLPKNLCGAQTNFFKQAGLKNIFFTTEKEGKILSERIF